MKTKAFLCLAILLLGFQWSHAQGTAFTYQGRLNASNAPANGSYDMTFALFDASSGGTQQGGLSAIFAIPVSNGLFAVTLDLGNNFPGADRWLEIAVRTNSGGALTTLSPRQKIAPTPYAITAGKAATATSFGGSLAGDVTGLQGATVVSSIGGKTAAAVASAVNDVNAATNTAVSGTIVRRDAFGAIQSFAITSSSFNGFGGGLTGLNAAQLASGTVPEARLSANIPLKNASQIFTGVNTFSNVTTIVGTQTGGWPNPVAAIQNTSPSGTASPALTVQATGNLVDGALAVRTTGTGYIARFGTADGWMASIDTNGTVAANKFIGPGALPWQVVAGTTQQAQPNTGYLVTNDALVTLTLPTAPNPGDLVRLTCAGSGGCNIAQNAGQVINDGYLISGLKTRTLIGSPPDGINWHSIACSADGTKLIAASDDGSTGSAGSVGFGYVYTSADSGSSWVYQSSPTGRSVASSSDGAKLVVVGKRIFTSTDSGASWGLRDTNSGWNGVASSADGTKLVAVRDYDIYTSADSGVNWTLRTWISNLGQSGYAKFLATSGDGTKIFVGGNLGLRISTDSGNTWTSETSSPNTNCNAVACSLDGTKVLAVAASAIYTSADSGATWTLRRSGGGTYACSSFDGKKLFTGGLMSEDSGATWVSGVGSGYACSADGTKVFELVGSTAINFFSPNSTSGPAGYLYVGPNASIELQYLGNGQFVPLSSNGSIQAH